MWFSLQRSLGYSNKSQRALEHVYFGKYAWKWPTAWFLTPTIIKMIITSINEKPKIHPIWEIIHIFQLMSFFFLYYIAKQRIAMVVALCSKTRFDIVYVLADTPMIHTNTTIWFHFQFINHFPGHAFNSHFGDIDKSTYTNRENHFNARIHC